MFSMLNAWYTRLGQTSYNIVCFLYLNLLMFQRNVDMSLGENEA